ncbi:MAG: ECF-type sigma factor [Thermoanaerobaculia bacterium]|nr:ECF-type sigma factor [Thermoanaerobaculia bacterium]
MGDAGEVTDLLEQWGRGDAGAFDRLVPLVYDQLKRLARGQLARDRDARRTLETTALVHEAYLKFVDTTRLGIAGRNHFYAVAARAMRQVLVERARRRRAARRGGGVAPATLDERDIAVDDEVESLLALEQALERLATESERCVRVVECRFFLGMGEEETAEALGVTSRTVQRDWLRARGRLRETLSPQAVARLSG